MAVVTFFNNDALTGLLPHIATIISSNGNPGQPISDPTGELGVRKKMSKSLHVYGHIWHSPLAITPILLACLTD